MAKDNRFCFHSVISAGFRYGVRVTVFLLHFILSIFYRSSPGLFVYKHRRTNEFEIALLLQDLLANELGNLQVLFWFLFVLFYPKLWSCPEIWLEFFLLIFISRGASPLTVHFRSHRRPFARTILCVSIRERSVSRRQTKVFKETPSTESRVLVYALIYVIAKNHPFLSLFPEAILLLTPSLSETPRDYKTEEIRHHMCCLW